MYRLNRLNEGLGNIERGFKDLFLRFEKELYELDRVLKNPRMRAFQHYHSFVIAYQTVRFRKPSVWEQLQRLLK